MLKFFQCVLSMIFFSVCVSSAYAQQSSDAAFIPPVMSLLLDQDQCPSVGIESTIEGDLSISTQGAINDLAGVTKIIGNLIFNSATPAVLDFSPLDSLVEVTGSINITRTALTVIDGFDCLSSVGGVFKIFDNGALTSISELPVLASVGGVFTIASNDELMNIPGFPELTSVGLEFQIFGNDMLTSIPEFPVLTSVGRGISINNNDVLTSTPEFPVLTSVGFNFQISGNAALTSISEFPVLTSVHSNFIISRNDMLTSIPEFPMLTFVGVNFSIDGNAALMSISEFPVLTSVGNTFQISRNVALTSISGFGSLGRSDITGDILIINNTQLNCSMPHPNFLPATSSSGNSVNCASGEFVFVSSMQYQGNLGGLEGADSKCQSLADQAQLPGTYKAWLSVSGSSPSTSFTQSSLPYVLTDGTTVIADDYADLTDGALQNSINLDENRAAPSPGTTQMWSNTLRNGEDNDAPQGCNGWTSSDSGNNGRIGDSFQSDANWTNNTSPIQSACSSSERLYCFGQVD